MSRLISEQSVTSPIIFLVVIFIALSHPTGLLAKNHGHAEGTIIAKPGAIPEDRVELFEHARNTWNSNQTETLHGSLEYLAKDTSGSYKSSKSTKSGIKHESTVPGHSPVKHGIKRRRRKHRHPQELKQDSDMTIEKTKEKVKPHKTPIISESESIPKSKSNAIEQAKKRCSSSRLNCTTKDEEALKNIRIQMFVKTLADKLRMTPEELKSRFNSKPSYKLPDEILEEPMDDSPEMTDNYYARDQRKIFPGLDMGKTGISWSATGSYRFGIGDEVSSISGQLWVYKTPDRHDSMTQSFFVYSLEKYKNGSIRIDSLIRRHETSVRKGWVVIPIDNLILPVNEDKEVMLAIRCKTCATRSHRALFGAKHKYAPLLVIDTVNHHFETRQKRDAESTCDPTYSCCKRNLEVNFGELGMSFRPEIVQINYCDGFCGKSKPEFTASDSSML